MSILKKVFCACLFVLCFCSVCFAEFYSASDLYEDLLTRGEQERYAVGFIVGVYDAMYISNKYRKPGNVSDKTLAAIVFHYIDGADLKGKSAADAVDRALSREFSR